MSTAVDRAESRGRCSTMEEELLREIREKHELLKREIAYLERVLAGLSKLAGE